MIKKVDPQMRVAATISGLAAFFNRASLMLCSTPDHSHHICDRAPSLGHGHKIRFIITDNQPQCNTSPWPVRLQDHGALPLVEYLDVHKARPVQQLYLAVQCQGNVDVDQPTGSHSVFGPPILIVVPT